MSKVVFWFDSQSMKVNLWQDTLSDFLQTDLLPNMPFLYNLAYLNKNKVDEKNLNLYLIEIRHYNVKNLKKLIKAYRLKFLKDNPTVNIIIYLPHETSFYGRSSGNFEDLTNPLDRLNLLNKKYFIFGDLNINERPKWDDSLKIFNKTFCFDYFEYWTYKNTGYDFTNTHEAEKVFLCLNRRLTFNKLALLSLLTKENYIENSYVSNLKVNSMNDDYIEEAKTLLHKKDKKYVNKILEQPPILLDHKDPEQYPSNYIDTDYYRKSYFSLIPETDINVSFITEKTYKAIVNQHPFIIWSAPFTLEYLKTKGYETYSSIFDESYDKEVDNSKRLYMIIDEVKKIINLSSKDRKQKFKSVEKIAEYNKTLFLERAEHNYKKQWKNIIEEIINDQKD